MTKYIVEGGRPLFGEIPISGAKNAAVAIIPAALMVSGPCRPWSEWVAAPPAVKRR